MSNRAKSRQALGIATTAVIATTVGVTQASPVGAVPAAATSGVQAGSLSSVASWAGRLRTPQTAGSAFPTAAAQGVSGECHIDAPLNIPYNVAYLIKTTTAHINDWVKGSIRTYCTSPMNLIDGKAIAVKNSYPIPSLTMNFRADYPPGLTAQDTAGYTCGICIGVWHNSSSVTLKKFIGDVIVPPSAFSPIYNCTALTDGLGTVLGYHCIATQTTVVI